MSSRSRGRHRAPGRHRPALALSAALVRHGGPAAHTSAVLLVSGTVAATLAIPAQAAEGVEGDLATATGSAGPSATASAGVQSVLAEVTDQVDHSGAAQVRAATNVTATTTTASQSATPAQSVTSSRSITSSQSATPTQPVTSPVTTSTPRQNPQPPATNRVSTTPIAKATVTKRLDRSAVRARSVEATRALNQQYPALTRTITRTTRNQTSGAGLKGAANAPVTAGGSAAVGIADGLTGIWYRWGGTTPAGFDCSGFTSYVYRKMGIKLPRTAAAQQAFARRVSTPQPGDLVFFGSPANHVGIYAGGGMMYDSPRTGRKTQKRKIYTSRVTYGRVG